MEQNNMKSFEKIRSGYKEFFNDYFESHKATFQDLVQKGQRPKTLLISCSDSRVNPSVIMNADPGDIFSVRNVGNLVPPYEHDSHYHGVSSAIEYAVKVLHVENIIIMGHAHCGAIQAVVETENEPDALGTEFIQHWVDIARDALQNPCCCVESIKSGNRIPKEIEQASIVNSMNNLMTFPFVKESVEGKNLNIYGLYFDMENGELTAFDKDENCFIPM